MATITAKAGGGKWNATTTWEPEQVPTEADDVILNAASGTVEIPRGVEAKCRSLKTEAFTKTLKFEKSGGFPPKSANLSVGTTTAAPSNTVWKFDSGTLTQESGKIIFVMTSAVATVQKIFPGSQTYRSVEFLTKFGGGAGGKYKLEEPWKIEFGLSHNTAELEVPAANTIECNNYEQSPWEETTATLVLVGKAKIILTGNGWSITEPAKYSITPGESEIKLTGASNQFQNFFGGGKTYYDVKAEHGVLTANSTNPTIRITGNNTFHKLILTEGREAELASESTTTVTTLVSEGKAGAYCRLWASEGGKKGAATGRAKIKAAAEQKVEYVKVEFIKAETSAFKNKHGVDEGNNEGWTFEEEPKFPKNTILDTFKRTESPLKGAGGAENWLKGEWAFNIGATAEVNGWYPNGVTGKEEAKAAMAYWHKEITEPAISVAANLFSLEEVKPENQYYMALWACTTGKGEKNGYRLQIIPLGEVQLEGGFNTSPFIIILEKWVAGVSTTLRQEEFWLRTRNEEVEFGLVVQGGIVEVWTKHSPSALKVKRSEIADSTFTSGFVGVEGTGPLNNGSFINFAAEPRIIVQALPLAKLSFKGSESDRVTHPLAGKVTFKGPSKPTGKITHGLTPSKMLVHPVTKKAKFKHGAEVTEVPFVTAHPLNPEARRGVFTEVEMAAGVPYTFSVYAKATKPGTIIYLNIGNEKIGHASKKCELTSEWTRYEVTLTPTISTNVSIKGKLTSGSALFKEVEPENTLTQKQIEALITEENTKVTGPHIAEGTRVSGIKPNEIELSKNTTLGSGSETTTLTFINVAYCAVTAAYGETFFIDGAMLNKAEEPAHPHAAPYGDGDTESWKWSNLKGQSVSVEIEEPAEEENYAVIDAVLVDPITPGVAFNVYYSNDLSGSEEGEPTVEEWENKLWTHVPQSFVTTTKQTYVLPEPIVCKFVKMEFSDLQAKSYDPGDFQKPVRYKKFPDWVSAVFLNLLNSPNFVARKVGVNYDALELAYEYYLDDLKQGHKSPFETGIVSGPFSNLVDPTTLAKINLTINTYLHPPAALGNTDTLLGAARVPVANATENYPVEVEPEWEGPESFPVSGIERSALVLDQGFPVMYFYVTCRHEYKELQAPFDQNRAYFAGLKELAFIRETYTTAADQTLYVESGADNINTVRNDFVVEDREWFAY